MIELHYVEKKYVSGERALYIDHLTLNAGEIVGVLGDNGSGKTTMLKAMAGMGELTNGTITFDGKPVSERYADLAFITEEGSYLPQMTPHEYGEFLRGYFPKFDETYYEELLRFFQLDPSKKNRSLSKGQRAKLELAAGFAKRATYILMDEPFLGMDQTTRTGFLKMIAAGLTGEETLVISTHFTEDFANLFDRALLLHHGRIRDNVAVDDLRQEGKTLEQFLAERRAMWL
ncbi:ABC transporter ATP-binding protein [Gorillibacterium massiliense]|uniref:ATP-binding cassette domain-containing protein n=1 Tax=Gorillibacterium massiliense TaxID=1280390 RepID=UPI0004BBED01|nr:ABC transporter ATP-binding protein [Gorillibacterium massiliense]